jgi:hypothetical protein
MEKAAVITPSKAPVGLPKSGNISARETLLEEDVLTILPWLDGLESIQNTPIITGRHFDTESGGDEAEV